MELSVPDAKAKLDDARWNLSQALEHAAGMGPRAAGLMAHLAQAHKHVVDVMQEGPFKRSFAEAQSQGPEFPEAA